MDSNQTFTGHWVSEGYADKPISEQMLNAKSAKRESQRSQWRLRISPIFLDPFVFSFPDWSMTDAPKAGVAGEAAPDGEAGHCRTCGAGGR